MIYLALDNILINLISVAMIHFYIQDYCATKDKIQAVVAILWLQPIIYSTGLLYYFLKR